MHKVHLNALLCISQVLFAGTFYKVTRWGVLVLANYISFASILLQVRYNFKAREELLTIGTQSTLSSVGNAQAGLDIFGTKSSGDLQ
jgi:hypothetical protein